MSVSHRPGSPGLARVLLALLLPAGHRQFALDDVEEEYAGLARCRGVRRAQWWYWRQVASAAFDRATRRRGSHGPGSILGGRVIATIWQDARFGVRLFARQPALAAAAIVTLALGIGATTAIFTIVNAAILRPMPYAAPERLVSVGHPDERGLPSTAGYLTIEDWRARSQTLEQVVEIRGWTPTLVSPSGAERLAGMKVRWPYFSMLGVRPAIGRDFVREEDDPQRWRVVMLSHGLWQRRFGGDASIVGKSIDLNGRGYQVVGVLPADFEPLISARYYQPAEIWAPLGYDAAFAGACRTCQHLRTVGRLRPEVTIEQARSELDGIQRTLEREHATEYASSRVAIAPLADELLGRTKLALLLLMGGVALVLLIACANVANLLVAQSTARAQERAVRTALGAERWRLASQAIVESLVLTLAGGMCGLFVARWTLFGLMRLAPPPLDRLDVAALDGRVLALALSVAVALGVLLGVAQAAAARRGTIQMVVRGRQTADRRRARGRGGLVVVDLALALVLLAAAGLMLRSVSQLLRVDPGFDPTHVLTMNYSLVGDAYAEDRRVAAFHDELLERVSALPGVKAAAVAGQIPLGGNFDRWGFHIQGRLSHNPQEDPSVERYSVTPGYFETLRIPLRRGRLFTAADGVNAVPVMLVSESTARALWAGAEPIGARVRIGDPTQGPWRTVVGIVGDVRHQDLASAPSMQMYLPQAQVTDSYVVLVLRTDGEPAALAAAAGQQVRAIARDVPVYDVATMEELVARSVQLRRFLLQLLAAFATLALLLAAVGVYGVVSYSVAQRTRELGIRLALGATRRVIVMTIVREGIQLFAVGVGAGLIVALAGTRLLSSQLFQVTPSDPVTFLTIIAILAAVAVVAYAGPARRAMRVDPVVALRVE